MIPSPKAVGAALIFFVPHGIESSKAHGIGLTLRFWSLSGLCCLIFGVSARAEPPGVDYFPSSECAMVFRNWDIVPHEQLARVLHCDKHALRSAGERMGLKVPPELSPSEVRRNVEIVLRRNWGLVPRSQIEALLGYTPQAVDEFLGKEIFLRALLAAQPAGLRELQLPSPQPASERRLQWFSAHVRKHLAAVADTPEEPRLAYLKDLCRPHAQGVRLPGAQAKPGEVNLERGWHILLPERAGDVLVTAVEDFRNYCRNSQRVRLELRQVEPHAASVENKEAVNETLALSIGAPLGQPEGYELNIASDRINIRGASETGVFRGLIELERRMTERGGLFLSPCHETNQPSFSPRYVSSYFSLLTDVLGQDLIDPFPDAYLNELAHQDADGVWIYTLLQDLVPTPVFSELGHGSAARLERLRSIIKHASKYGLKVYLYFNEPRAQFLPFFEKHPEVKGQPEGNTAALCTSTEAVQRHLRGSFENLFRQAPGLGGVFVITASENLANCYSHSRDTSCPRCRQRKPADVIADSIRCMAEGVWAADPAARFIVWDWSWHSVLGEQAPEEIIRKLPKGVALMADFERGTVIERGGVREPVEEYSLSVIGPSPRAVVRGRQAQRLGFDYFAKIQLSTTWECGTVPFIPVPNLLFRKANAMRGAGVTGAMATWTIGSHPSPDTEAFSMANWNPSLSEEEALRRIAARRYGPDAAAGAVRGWTKLSEAFTSEYPFPSDIYTAPLQHGPSLPWYRNPLPLPYGRASLLNSKDDWQNWPHPYGPEKMSRLLNHLCDRWDDGLNDLREVCRITSGPRRALAEKDFGVAWMVGYTFRAYADALDFYKAREAGDTRTMQRLAKKQIALTEEALRRVRADSRIGWEAELQYFYRPMDVLERLISLDAIVEPP
ncbi:MAG: hypothetical protein C5B50_10905 [Verrucomicrobia bacterium]|nr:MAG: hypothetical protein C5B50_10905 [Verrucomicrobiota bacterium]